MQTTDSDEHFARLYQILRAHGIDAIDTMTAEELNEAKAILETRILLYEEKLQGNNFKEVAENYRKDLHWYRTVLEAVTARINQLVSALVSARASMMAV